MRALQITSRLSYRRNASETTQADDDNEAGADASHEREDRCEDLPDKHDASDFDMDEPVVDTDGPSSDESVIIPSQPQAAHACTTADVAPPAYEPATGGPCVFDNGYF